MKYCDFLKMPLTSVRRRFHFYSHPDAKIRICAHDFENKQLTSACDVSSLPTEYIYEIRRSVILRQTTYVSLKAHMALANWPI